MSRLERAAPRPWSAVVFDLDGTLTDPAEGIANSVLYALSRFGITVADKRELYAFIGPPLADSFGRYYGFDRKTSEDAIGFYREYFKDRGIFEYTLTSPVK